MLHYLNIFLYYIVRYCKTYIIYVRIVLHTKGGVYMYLKGTVRKLQLALVNKYNIETNINTYEYLNKKKGGFYTAYVLKVNRKQVLQTRKMVALVKYLKELYEEQEAKANGKEEK